jgi:hypothetical protein
MARPGGRDSMARVQRTRSGSSLKTGAVIAFAAFALGATSAMAVPSDEPNRGQTFYDYPPPVWVEAGAVQRWLDAPGIERVGTGPCPEPSVPDYCGGEAIPRGVPPAEGLNPLIHIKAGIAARVGQVIRFHLPGASDPRPVLRVGQKGRLNQNVVTGGQAYRLGGTDAPWWRVRKGTRSGFATLTTSTGIYWFKLAVRP